MTSLAHLNPRLTSGAIQPIAGTERQRAVFALDPDGHTFAHVAQERKITQGGITGDPEKGAALPTREPETA